MRYLMLLLAPVLYGQPGLVTVQAGALSCGAVMRSQTTIQSYCYGPGSPLAIVHNRLDTLNDETLDDYQWCIHQTGCTLVQIHWDFKLVPTGISWAYSINGNPAVSGTLTAVYGSVTKVGTLVNGNCTSPTGIHIAGGSTDSNPDGTLKNPSTLQSNETEANCILK